MAFRQGDSAAVSKASRREDFCTKAILSLARIGGEERRRTEGRMQERNESLVARITPSEWLDRIAHVTRPLDWPSLAVPYINNGLALHCCLCIHHCLHQHCPRFPHVPHPLTAALITADVCPGRSCPALLTGSVNRMGLRVVPFSGCKATFEFQTQGGRRGGALYTDRGRAILRGMNKKSYLLQRFFSRTQKQI